MNIQKWVKKSEKWMLGTIVVVMALSLVYWGDDSMGQTGSGGTDTVGMIYGTRQVLRADLRAMRPHLRLYKIWNKATDFSFWFGAQRGKDPLEELEIAETESEELCWQLVTLLEEADRQQLTVTESDLSALKSQEEQIIQMFLYANRISQPTPEQRSMAHQYLFRATPKQLAESKRVIAKVEKLLKVLAESEFQPYDEVYKTEAKGSLKAKVSVATLDPAQTKPGLPSVRASEIATQYEGRKSQLERGPRVRVEYVFAAKEDFTAGLEIPDADIEKYYNDHKDEFSASPGGEGASVKPLDEVRETIRERLRETQLTERARTALQSFASALGKELETATGTDKEKEFDLKPLLERFRNEGKPLRHGVTLSYRASAADDVAQMEGLGKSERDILSSWPFESTTGIGRFTRGDKFDRTDKGVAMYRLVERQEKYTPDVTFSVESWIRRQRLEEHRNREIAEAAERVKRAIQEKGFEAGRAESGLQFVTTRYFDFGGRETTGLGDTTLENSVRQRMQQHAESVPPRIGTCEVIAGSSTEAGTPYQIAYLADVAHQPDPEHESDFDEEYRSRLESYRRDAARREAVIQRVLLRAQRTSAKPVDP